MEKIREFRKLPIGAEILPKEGVHFRVWAPRPRKVEVVLEGKNHRVLQTTVLKSEKNGYFSGLCPEAKEGSLYRYRLDHGGFLFPDPASRFQPRGPHEPSCVIDPSRFSWSDKHWQGIRMEGQVLYEMHIGTFTREGTWKSARRELARLKELGITAVEMMPVAEFPGRFGWGYDGVDHFAPTHLYGEPDDFRRFVDHAHSQGMGVILDVVYNHIGPDGNYLKNFATDYFTDRHKNEWGEAINFDGENSDAVREFFVTNAGYWIDEFHIDGLRLDATHQIFDCSREHILSAIARRVRESARGRSAVVIAENEFQEARIVRPLDQGGYGIDGLWNDDFHHSAMVAMTGRREAYYADYLGSPQELVSAIKRGTLFQGQYHSWRQRRWGTPALGIRYSTFVHYLQNHDQIANSGRGLRIHQVASPGVCRAMTALLLLGPETPMLFQGQEFAASSPFLFFADHKPDLAKLVQKGRAEFLSQFSNLALDPPSDPSTFERSKLDHSEHLSHPEACFLHQDLIALRREDPVFSMQRPDGVDGAVLGDHCFVLRFFASEGEDRILLLNLDADLCLHQAPEPLLAPPEGKEWQLLWSSENPRYGGMGTIPLEREGGWLIQGQAVTVLKAAGN